MTVSTDQQPNPPRPPADGGAVPAQGKAAGAATGGAGSAGAGSAGAGGAGADRRAAESAAAKNTAKNTVGKSAGFENTAAEGGTAEQTSAQSDGDAPAPPPAATAPARPRPTVPPLAWALLREARPKQWVKNLLVFAAPFAADKITRGATLGAGLIAFAAFCLAASAVYFANDALDVEADRAHPVKRSRPIAAGTVPIQLAWICVLVLALAALAVGLADNPAAAGVIGLYLAMNLSYSLWLKHLAVLDLAVVTGGFLLRAMMGGAAAQIPLSQWFLLTAGFGSLFMVAGKRYSELALMGDTAADTRRALADYSLSYLRFVWQTAAGLTILTYSLWAFSLEVNHASTVWHEWSIVPWTFLLLRYAMFVDGGRAGEPEDVVLGDRVIAIISLVWLVSFAAGVYSAG